jgi:ATP-binding cassette subfamily F protein uup
MAEPAFYRQAAAEIGKTNGRLEELQKELEAAYSRWEKLLAIKEG